MICSFVFLCALDAGCDKPDSFIVYSQGEVVETLQDHSLWIQDSSGNTQPDVATFKMEGQELAAKHGVAGVVTVDVNDKAGDVDVNGKAGDVTAQPGTVCCAVSPHLRAAYKDMLPQIKRMANNYLSNVVTN